MALEKKLKDLFFKWWLKPDQCRGCGCELFERHRPNCIAYDFLRMRDFWDVDHDFMNFAMSRRPHFPPNKNPATGNL